MAKPLVYIPEPCKADFNTMPGCEKGLYCSICQKHVLDLRKKQRNEVETVLKQNPGACVVMDDRHVAGKKAWGWAENFAGFMRRYKLQKIAAVFVAMCLLLASCRRRTMGGAYAWSGKEAGPQQKTEQL